MKNENQTGLFDELKFDSNDAHKHVEEQAKRKKDTKSNKGEIIDLKCRYCGTCKYHRGCNVEGVKRNSVGQCLDYRHMFAPNLRSI